MPRLYTVSFEAATWASGSGDIDVFSFLPATGRVIELLSVELSQYSEPTTEEEQVRLSVWHGGTSSGTGGASALPIPHSGFDAAAGFTARTNDTGIVSGGTPVRRWTGTWNTRAPGPIFPPLPQGGGYWAGDPTKYLVVRLGLTIYGVNDEVTAQGTATLCEYP